MLKSARFFVLLAFPFYLNAQTFTATGGPIPDDGTISTFDLVVSGLPVAIDTQNFGIESVCLNAAHTWDSDLSVSLRAPDGTTIPLFSGIGGDLDGFENTCLSGNAAISIFEAPHPFTGTFRPTGDMGAINNGQNPNGVWQLVILDTYAFADAGELYDWSVTFGSQPCKPFPFSSSDLPIIKINTGGQPIPNEPKIDAEMLVIDNGPGQRNFLNQPFTTAGPIGVELHGNSTQGFPKKSLRIETRNALGEDEDVSLLGLPATSDFVLSANFSDKTLMRNALTYDFSRRLGQYASRTRFCEVFVDNTYQGVYVLTEKIKRGKERVDVPKLDESDTTGVALTGGYLVSIDWNSSPGWNSQFPQPNSPNNYLTYFQHEYPKWDEIHPKQQDYIRGYVDSFEVALHGPDFQNPETGWRRFADEKSFLDFLFINEISRNIDGYRLSTYFYKQRDDKGGKLRMGPVWDFDLAWYNSNYCDGWLTSGWAFNINYVCPGDVTVPFWWERLMQDTLFTQNLSCRWQSLRATTLHTDSIFAAIDSMAAVVDEAQARNFDYWPILGVYVWPNPGALPDTYAGEVQKMKNWISERLDWLDFAFGQNAPTLNADFAATPLSALEWQFSPEQTGGDYTYFWDFDDGTTSTAAAPQHQFPGTGTYEVKLTLSTNYGCESEAQQIIHIVNTGTNEGVAGLLQVFPNPAHDRLTLTLPDDFSEKFTLKFVNSLGETTLEKTFSGNEKQVSIGVSDLPAGAYGLSVEGAAKRLATRVILH